MPRGKRIKTEEIIMNLRQVEVDLAKGRSIEEACRKIGIATSAYYRWRQKYGGMEIGQAKELKDLERENARLKKLVADLSLDNAMLKDIASGKF
tara:strand:- start:1066 stop:1347 length:282 start_codon:yes stop_codon:yes gene_type:complete